MAVTKKRAANLISLEREEIPATAVEKGSARRLVELVVAGVIGQLGRHPCDGTWNGVDGPCPATTGSWTTRGFKDGVAVEKA